MIFLEIIVGALMAVILMHIGHTLGEEKADREIITKFNSLRGQLRKEIHEEIKIEEQYGMERSSIANIKYVGTTADEVRNLLMNMQKNIDTYGYVSASTFNQLTGTPNNFQGDDLGWLDLEAAEIYDDERGYILELPNPINLNELKGEK